VGKKKQEKKESINGQKITSSVLLAIKSVKTSSIVWFVKDFGQMQ